MKKKKKIVIKAKRGEQGSMEVTEEARTRVYTHKIENMRTRELYSGENLSIINGLPPVSPLASLPLLCVTLKIELSFLYVNHL